MIRKKGKPRENRPVITVRKVAGQWRAKCPKPCSRQFDHARSENALSACVQHAYRAHGWTKHEVKFH
jgi:hypothetical protein